MPDAPTVCIVVNGQPVLAPGGSTVAAAILNLGLSSRRSVSGEPRAPICGMGICFECRATVDGVAHRRTCQLPVREGMSVETPQEMVA
jgi:sarcosine oxidase subunit alpha